MHTQQESCQLLHTHVTSSPRRCWRQARCQGRPRPALSPCGLRARRAPAPYLSQFERGLSGCMRVGVEASVAEERRSQKTTGSMPIGSRSCSVAACSPRAPIQKKPQSLDLGCCLPCYRASYRKMHFPGPTSPRDSRIRESGEGARMKTDEGWTKRVKRGTTASPSQSYHPHSVRPDDGSTLAGLECLQADLCRALGRVSTRPSALPDRLL